MSFARVRALVIVGVLFVCAVTFVGMAMVKDTQRTANAGSSGDCPAGYVPADLRLPEEKNIKINVYNATDRQGLAERVAFDFENREFTIVNKDKIRQANDPLKKRVDGVAALRYGPKAVGAAWVLRAYFLAVTDEDFTTEFDLNRKDNPATKDVDEREVVDVVVGTKFRQLGTVTEVNQSLAALGTPTLPKGTCDGTPR